MRQIGMWICAASLMLGSCTVAKAADHRWGLNEVGPKLKSAGPLAFGPDSILLVGDGKQAAIFALQTSPEGQRAENLNIERIDLKIAEEAGVAPEDIAINDMATHPETGAVYLSVHITDGDDAVPMIWIADSSGVVPMTLEKSQYAQLDMPSPPEDKVVGSGRRQRNPRDESVTGLTYADGRVLVSGLSSGEAPSSVWEFQFPFGETNSAASVEIYHTAHGQFEDSSAIRAFVAMPIDGELSLLAGYTCTPLVKLPLDAVRGEDKVRGTTLAELGNWNRPLDMLVYERDGESYVLMANSARGTMKISLNDVAQREGLTEPVKGGGTAGLSFEQIESMKDLVKMDRLGDQRLLALTKAGENGFHLKTFDLP